MSSTGGGGGDTGPSAKRSRGGGVSQHNSLLRIRNEDDEAQRVRAADRQARALQEEKVDEAFGFTRLTSGPAQTGFIFNLRATTVREEAGEHDLAAVELFFVRDDGSTFKALHLFRPYFLLRLAPSLAVSELEEWLARRFDGLVDGVEMINKEDLDLANHLTGLLQPYAKVYFRNTNDLNAVRKVIYPAVMHNRRRAEAASVYAVDLEDINNETAAAAAASDPYARSNGGNNGGRGGGGDRRRRLDQILDSLLDIREYDVSLTQRLEIDLGTRVGLWYDVAPISGSVGCTVTQRKDIIGRPLLKVFAFDIETCKAPLKFPVADVDPIMMISIMVDGEGLLIVNREIVSEDIHDFEYTPKPDFHGPFRTINAANERETLVAFIDFIKETKPLVYVTYNGDFFDWPFIDKRSQLHGLSLHDEIGMSLEQSGEFKGRFAVHMDAFYWVKRDSYLPQGSHGLKAVTKAKLKYDPVELDPEDMLPFAIQRPQVLASYSVSDAVATYYLYMKYIHLFIFSLCTIIPLSPDDVLRRGSGTLCESLLMVQAFETNVVAPNKQIEQPLKFHEGHLLESETYIGGHVECLHSGIFRTDIPVQFNLNAKYIQELIDNIDHVIRFCIEVESQCDYDTVDPASIAKVREDIKKRLEGLRDKPNQVAPPLIYHLDVAAMYPNIILSNRLQPYAMVEESDCAACDFNTPDATCKRTLQWAWRGKYYVASKADYASIRASLEHEPLTAQDLEAAPHARRFGDLRDDLQAAKITSRVKVYCRSHYKKLTEEKTEIRDAVTCQREHPFYIDTVRGFRDRRYEYKALNKTWGKKKQEAKSAIDVAEANNMILLYDSMQLAHKCILNSFYGYVMRKGARWCSMPMAGVVTKTGASIIQCAEELVWAVGEPLELDTDGIWCVLPDSFPDNYELKSVDPTSGAAKRVFLNYPCSVLNRVVALKFTNHQYATLTDPVKRTYATSSECSIMFEVDGPYRAMVLPASQHEGKNIKKRYAVFNEDGSLAELKGFEIKRRGELKLIKIFQGEVFKTFLDGDSLADCYKHVGAVGDRWLDVLYSKGADLEDHDLFDLISENKSMSETLESYGDARSTSITCARRLGELLGAEMVKDKGLNCKFVISRMPMGAPVSERAVPVAVFSMEPAIKHHYLRRWLRDASLNDFDIRNLLDWAYYTTRLGSAIQKIITIPAAFQGVPNPCPRVEHPDWLAKELRRRNDKSKQVSLKDMFSAGAGGPAATAIAMADIEDGGDSVSVETSGGVRIGGTGTTRITRKPRTGAAARAGGGGIMSDGADGDDDAVITGEGMDPETSAAATAAERAALFADADDPFNPGAAGAKSSRKKGGSARDDKEDFAAAALTLSGPKPDINDDYQAWLRWQKAQWRAEREERRQREASLFGAPLSAPANAVKLGARGLQGFVADAARAVQVQPWHVLQALPSASTPGVFDVWVLIGGLLDRVQVTVSRTFYLNTRLENELGEGLGRRVDRVLPRGRRQHYLYEVTVSEEEFRRDFKDVASLSDQPMVEGVYETQVPLSFSLTLAAGAVCLPARVPGREAFERRKEFLLEQLQPWDAAAGAPVASAGAGGVAPPGLLSGSPYLQGVAVNKLFLYHAAASGAGQRHVLALVPSNGAVGTVVTVGTGAEKANHQHIYAEACAANGVPFNPAETPFEVTQHNASTLTEAYALIKSALLSAKDAAGSVPSIVVACVPESQHQLLASLPVLRTDFPFLLMPFNADDANFPPLRWSATVIRRAYDAICVAPLWWHRTVALAQSANVPVCSFPADGALHALDVVFARALKQAGHVLWASPGENPDAGGSDLDTRLFDAELSNPELLNPGCYRCVSAEIDVSHLALNAIVQHSLVTEAEVGAATAARALVAASGGLTGTGSGAAEPAFEVLRGVVSGAVSEVNASGDADVEQVLLHLYRWLHTPRALMFDPLLHAFVHKAMRKTFQQLLATLKSLNCTIVYASFAKIIVATGKPTLARGVSFLTYVINAVSAKAVFSSLMLTPVGLWEAFLFMDACNFGGLRVIDDEEPAPGEGGEPQLQYVSNWNAGEFLPAAAAEVLTAAVSDFLHLPFAHMAELEGPAATAAGGGGVVFSTSQEREAHLVSFVKEILEKQIQRRLLAGVTEVQRRHPNTQTHSLAAALVSAAKRRAGANDDDDAAAGDGLIDGAGNESGFKARTFDADIAETLCCVEFPVLPGSHLPLRDPALEMIKTVCHILSLDSRSRDTVLVVRSNLLLKIDVQPFSDAAQFRNPCLTLVLPDVTCQRCNTSRDLDLCRDPGLFVTEGDPGWRCPACAYPTDRPAVELALVRIAQRRLAQFQVQDLECVRCRDIKTAALNPSCPCSGVYVHTRSPDAQRRGLFTLLNIARFHRFDHLREIVEWALMM